MFAENLSFLYISTHFLFFFFNLKLNWKPAVVQFGFQETQRGKKVKEKKK